jgi:hypothetical protein
VTLLIFPSRNEYGGVVFAYNPSYIRIWAPDASNGNSNGYLLFVGDGWAGEKYAMYENVGNVRIKAWKEDSDVPQPDYESPWYQMSSQNGALSFK